jgi:hypothetical protein
LLPCWAVALILGLVLGESVPLAPLALVPAAALAVFTFFFAHRPALWCAGSVLAVVLAGVNLSAGSGPASDEACSPINHLRRGERVRVLGRIATAARRGERSQHQQLALSWKLGGMRPWRMCG